MEKSFEKLIEDYEQILDNEFVDLKKRILSKLEGILNGITSQEDLLDKPLDYNSMLKNVKNDSSSTRIKNVLKASDIKTYKDLQRECYNSFINRNGDARFWKDEKSYIYYLHSFRNFGYKGIDVLISHLKSINFDFSKESAQKVAEKNKA